MTNETANLLNKAIKHFDIEFIKRPLISLISLKHLNDKSHSEKGLDDLIFPEEANWIFLKDKINSHFFSKQIDNAFQTIEDKNPQLQDMFSSFDFAKNFGKEKSNEPALKNLFLAVSEIDFYNNKLPFGKFFDETLYQIAQLQGRKGGVSIQPPELTELMLSFAPKQKSLSVYNPFAGYASLAIGLPENAIYYGQELDYEICAMGKLRIMAHGLLKRSTLNCEDSLTNWNSISTSKNAIDQATHKTLKHDFIIGIPPLGLKIKKHPEYSDISTNQITADSFFLEKAAKNLSKNGLAVLITTNSFLSSYSNIKLRRSLINKDLIEYVINLPSNILYQTSLHPVLIVINKEKKRKNQVKFIDAAQLALDSKDGKTRKLDINGILNAIKNEDPPYFQEIDNIEIEKQDFILTKGRYSSPEIRDEFNSPMTYLNDILEIISGQPLGNTQKGKAVRIKDLKNDKIDYNINVKELEEDISPKSFKKIEESCLLFTLFTRNIRPTFFNYTGTPVYIARNLVAARITSKDFILPYLINELHADYVEDQLERFRGGTAQPVINRKDFLKLKIQALSIQEQKITVRAAIEAASKLLNRSAVFEAETSYLKEEIFRDISSIRHSFRQLLNAMASNVKGTYKFVAKNSGKPLGLDTLYSKNLNQTFGEHLQSVEETVGLMTRLIQDLGEKRKKSSPKLVNLAELLIQVQQRFKNPDIFTFEELYIDQVSFMDNDGAESKPLTIIDIDDFNILFSNIVSNAIDHGFREPGKNYKIRTSLSLAEESSGMILEVSNNGRPAPKNFSEQDLTTRGEKTRDSRGAGTGGADIKTIINSFGGEFKWINSPEEDFPVTYVLRFPFIDETITE